MAEFPAHPDAVTPDWLGRVLGAGVTCEREGIGVSERLITGPFTPFELHEILDRVG